MSSALASRNFAASTSSFGVYALNRLTDFFALSITLSIESTVSFDSSARCNSSTGLNNSTYLSLIYLISLATASLRSNLRCFKLSNRSVVAREATLRLLVAG